MKNKKNLTPEAIEHIIARLVDYANDTEKALKNNKNDVFYLQEMTLSFAFPLELFYYIIRQNRGV